MWNGCCEQRIVRKPASNRAHAPHRAEERCEAQKFMSDRPRFHAEKNHKFTLGRSPDLQAKPFVCGFRSSTFPGCLRVAYWKIHCPEYSGGTVPDSHRLPCYALAGTQKNVRFTISRFR